MDNSQMQNLKEKIEPQKIETFPLVVDLDGTLIQTDILIETFFSHVSAHPLKFNGLFSAFFRGKAALKSHIAETIDIDASVLPYNNQVIELIQEARAAGVPVYLASASNERYVEAVAAHLGLFDGWFASSAVENLSSTAKARKLSLLFGDGGFDYIGNEVADLEVWAKARHRIAVNPPPAVEHKLLALDGNSVVLSHERSGMKSWTKQLRVHQWVKNALVFVPIITSQALHPSSLVHAFVAFFAFSLAASGIYLINDLADLEADRKHLSKRHRPLASGTIPLFHAILAAPVLIVLALFLAFLSTPWLGGVLLSYIAITTAYTFVLKRKMMVDVVALAMLYTLRVVGGAAAISVPVSEWLLAFSMFIFTALALIKRYSELAGRLDANLPDPTNRNYRKLDLDVITALAAASGFNAVTVFTLYISSDTVRQLYATPQLLWLICPVLMYWMGRILILAHRRHLHDDPIIFALRDKNSLACAAVVAMVVVAAAIGNPIDALGLA